MKITSINPSTGKVLGEIEASTEADVKQAIYKAHKAKANWQALGINGRNKYLKTLYDLFESNKPKLALLVSQEMGMPITEAISDIDYGLDFLRWYSDHATEYLAPEVTYENETEIHTVYRVPYGVAAVIVPWNFPFSNFVWQVGQNLVSGNTVVFKHSEEVPLFGKKMEAITNASPLPEGVLNFIHGDGKIGDFLVHQEIDLICFTGSTKTGQYLYQVAAEKFIPAVMELGGSAPGIIFADADIENIIDTIVLNRYSNCGQICDGLKRLIVHQSRVDEFIDKFKAKVDQLVIGNATDKDTTFGPLVAERQLTLLKEQLEDALNKGAEVIFGGKEIKSLGGYYFQPTLVTNITKAMRLWHEEVFGPILPMVTFDAEKEAIELANDTIYGLGGYIFTNDIALFDRVATKLQTGMVSQNDISYVRECNPFGGTKKSGLGREHGKYGFHDVTQIKLVAKRKK